MAQINIKIDDKLKNDVSAIFNEMGLDITTGIKIYLKRVQRDRRIPFELSSSRFDAEKLAQQYRAGDQDVVDSLNSLFAKLGHQDHSAGIGGRILNQQSATETPDQGIGPNILNKR